MSCSKISQVFLCLLDFIMFIKKIGSMAMIKSFTPKWCQGGEVFPPNGARAARNFVWDFDLRFVFSGWILRVASSSRKSSPP